MSNSLQELLIDGIQSRFNSQASDQPASLPHVTLFHVTLLHVTKACRQDTADGLRNLGQIKALSKKSELDLALVLSDAATFIGLGECLYNNLSNLLKRQGGDCGLTQTASYLLVDLWGRILACKVLLRTVVQSIGAENFSVESTFGGTGQQIAKADLLVLHESTLGVLSEILNRLGKVDSFSKYAELADLLVSADRNQEYQKLRLCLAEYIGNIAN